MFAIAQRFVTAFGACATVAILCSGCATTTNSAGITYEDLTWYAVDCKHKAEQIKFLQSLRKSPDDQLMSISGWTGEDRKFNYLLNSYLVELSTRCK